MNYSHDTPESHRARFICVRNYTMWVVASSIVANTLFPQDLRTWHFWNQYCAKRRRAYRSHRAMGRSHDFQVLTSTSGRFARARSFSVRCLIITQWESVLMVGRVRSNGVIVCVLDVYVCVRAYTSVDRTRWLCHCDHT